LRNFEQGVDEILGDEWFPSTDRLHCTFVYDGASAPLPPLGAAAYAYDVMSELVASAGADLPTAARGLTFRSDQCAEATGLDYFGARYLSAAQGRFTSPDPHNEGAQLVDPQSWNMYSYVRNNPLRYVDPDGQDYHVCIDGQGCQDMTDSQYDQWRKKYKDQIYVSASGRIEDRDEQKIGQATWFDGDAVRRIENAQAPYGPKTQMSAFWANSAFNRAYYGPWGQP